MATLWSLRTGLELLEEKLARWNDSSLTKLEGSSILQHRLSGEVRVASADGDAIDEEFACE
eukprot:3874553-Pleurochrysis_carterae.AAC.1